MADDGWDVSDAISTATPVAAPRSASNDGWDVSEAVGAAPATTSAYEAAGGRSTWGDVVQGVVAGGHGVAADAAGALAAVQEPGGPQAATQAFALSQAEAARQAEQGMTPAGQAPGFFKHPLVSTAEAAPGIVALAAPAALAGPFAPVVVGGLMGGQQLGSAQNRAAEQGYELTPEQKLTQFGIGAATGLVPELGLSGKIATSPLIDRALGVIEGGATFGAGAAGSEAASQQSEIGAGKRQGYDTSAIVGAAETGVEQGAAFKAAHAEPGVSASPTRSVRDYRKPETKVAAPVDVETPAANKGVPPPPPKVDPAQEAALNPKPVTPGVTNPPEKPVEQPAVAQPTAPPPPTNREAPPAGDTTQPGGTPQPEARPQPPPTAGPPAENVDAIVPESAETLAAQHAALLDPANDREAMVWPKGSQPIELTDKKQFGQTPLPDGRIVQFDKSGPSGLSVAKIRQYAKDNRLDEALQYGPVSKDEAISRTLAGEPGAVVTERTADGVPVKDAAGTTATVPDQAAAMEATKTPGSTIEVRSPEQSIGERLKSVQAEMAARTAEMDAGERGEFKQPQPQPQPQAPVVQPEVAPTSEPVTPRVTQTPFGPGRVVEDISPEGQRAREAAAADDARQAQAVQEQLKAKEAARQAAAAEEAGAKAEAKRSHAAKADQEKVAAANAAAEKIVANHPHTGSYADVNALTARVKSMARAAGTEGIEVPKAFPEGHPWNAAMVKLREAKDMLAPIKKELGETREDKLGRFIDREHMIDSGRVNDALEARRAEGKQGLGSPEGAVETVAPKGGAADEEGRSEEREGVSTEERPEELTGGEGTEEHEEKPPDALAAAREERDRKIAAARAESEAMRKEAPASKAAVGFQVATKKSRAIKLQEGEGEGEHNVVTTDKDGHLTSITPLTTMTAKEALDATHNPYSYSESESPMVQRLQEQLVKIAGDTKVHFISDREMQRIAGGSHYGFYDPARDHIVMNAERQKGDTALHELFHAATTKALNDNPELRNLMNRLRNEVRANMGSFSLADHAKMSYALSDPEEFLTAMMTNPAVQKLLKGVKISEQLARDIGIPKWRKMTGWHGVLHIIQQALGLGPRDVSAIEGAMSVSEQAMWQHPRGTGDLMEAMGRGARADAAESAVSLPKLRFSKEDPPERDQEAYLKTPSEHIASIKNIDKEMVKGYTKDLGTNLKTGLLAKTAKFLSGTQLSDLHGKIFTDLKGNIIEAINRARDKVSHAFNEARKADRDIINRGYILDQKYKSSMPDYAELVNMSARYNIHAEKDMPKVPANPADAPRKNWQTNANYTRAKELYASLPDELQKRYRDEKQYYIDKQKELANTVLDKVLPVLDLDKDMEARVRSNDLTDDDWEKLEDMHAATPIKNAQRLLNKKDVYFPGKRDGNWVVTGHYEMPKGGSDTDATGKQLADNKREFDTEAEAHAYVTATHMPATVRETTYWTNPQGKTERAATGEAASTGKVSNKYEVSLETQHTEMHDTPAEAAKARAEMEKAGVTKDLSGVLDKSKDRAWSSLGSGEQRALERRIMGRDNLTTAEKQHLIESTRQLALGSQSGMAPHLLQSRKVAGMQSDSAAALDSYSRAINQHIARNAHSAELSQAMERLDNHEKATTSDANSTMRSIIGNTMRDRVYDPGINSKISPLIHRLMTMSFINFLVRPSHIFLSQVHPYVYSVPAMAGRHGYWKALQAQRQAMADLGGQFGNLGRGAKASAAIFKSLREKDTEKAVALAHGDDPIRAMIGRLKDAGEREAMMRMYETQHLHSTYDQSMFAGGGMDRTNAMMQQFTNAMEANNRLSTALAAYRLEKGATGDHANALQYGRRIIEETHGLYSASNTAPIFKNPLMRATLQFHQQPMNLAFMLYRNAFKAFKGDSEARWTLAYQLGTAALLGGMGGMPMDLPKLMGIATQPVTGMAPSDWDDKMRREIADFAGPTVANAVMEGVPGMMGPLGPSLGHRMGFDAGVLNDEPKSGSPTDISAWAFKNVVGAPGNMLLNWLGALHSLEGGDYQKAAEQALPGSLADFAKAYRLGTTGVQAGGKTIRPASVGDAILQTAGFSGVERERQTEGHKKLQEAIKNQPKTVAEQLKAKQAAKRQGATILGQKVTPKNAALVRDYANAYQ